MKLVTELYFISLHINYYIVLIIHLISIFKEIKEEGLMYRALVCQVGTPTGEDTVLKGTGGFSQLLLNWEVTNTCS